jgi:hypothetical protein
MHRESADESLGILHEADGSIREYVPGPVEWAGRFAAVLAAVGAGVAYSRHALPPVAGLAGAAVVATLYVAAIAPSALLRVCVRPLLAGLGERFPRLAGVRDT